MFRVLLIAALTFGLAACSLSKNDGSGNQQKVIGEKDGDLTPNQKVIKNVSKNVILQTYLDLASNAATLNKQAKALAANPTQANLDAAASAWRSTRTYWERTEAFLFGPVESLGLDPMMDTWPLNRADLDAILNSSNAITADTIRSIGTNLKGFHVVEYLLFGNGEATNHRAIADFTAREATYLTSVTQVLEEDTARLARAWDTQSNPDDSNSLPYATLIMNPGHAQSPYGSETAVLAEFVNGMIGIADEVGNGKIAEPLGDSLANVKPEAEESPFSWNSLADFSDNIRSIRMVYSGLNKVDSDGSGIYSLVAAKDPALATQVSQQIDKAIASIEGIAGTEGIPFRLAIKDAAGRERCAVAQKELATLHGLLLEKVLPLLTK